MAPTPTSASSTFTRSWGQNLLHTEEGIAFQSSVPFSHFWAVFHKRTHDGTKFAVTERPVKQVRRDFCTETAETVIEEQKSRWGKCF